MRSSTPRAAAAQKVSIPIDVFEIVAGTSSDSACSPSNLLARTANYRRKIRAGREGGDRDDSTDHCHAGSRARADGRLRYEHRRPAGHPAAEQGRFGPGQGGGSPSLAVTSVLRDGTKERWRAFTTPGSGDANARGGGAGLLCRAVRRPHLRVGGHATETFLPNLFLSAAQLYRCGKMTS